jgi:hypothetical protein
MQPATNARADTIAAGFFCQGGSQRFEIYSYPGLGLIDEVIVEGATFVGDAFFEPARGTFHFLVRDARGSMVTEWHDDGRLVRVGHIPHRDILDATMTKLGLAFYVKGVDRPRVIRVGPDGKQQLIATDAATPAVSGIGDVVFAARDEDRHEKVALWIGAEAKTHELTAGPSDVVPDISHDGTHVTYFRPKTAELVHCKNTQSSLTDCEVILVDHELIYYNRTAMSPAGDEVAYVTGKAPEARLRIIRLRDRRVREVAVGNFWCNPVWSSPSSIWVRPGRRENWRELSSVSGEPTGRTWTPPPGTPPGGPATCYAPPTDAPFRVHVESSWQGEVRLLAGKWREGPQ